MSTVVFPAPQPWKKLYIAALFEEDREQLARRISQARSAAIKRSRELFQQDPMECNEERSALNNALRSGPDTFARWNERYPDKAELRRKASSISPGDDTRRGRPDGFSPL
jgi:hypothetical protein